MRRAEFVTERGKAAAEAGRALAGELLALYVERYHPRVVPPPALIVDEIITDFLGCTLLYAPLDLDTFAKTEWTDKETVVTVNAKTADVPGVRDAKGVQNVAKWHECIHITSDEPEPAGPQPSLFEMDPPKVVVCYRGGPASKSSAAAAREFWAEEAGRAAAVSYTHLRRSAAFMRLLKSGSTMPNSAAWHALYEAAGDIHVNGTALVTQLQHDGVVVVEHMGGRRLLRVQPSLGRWPELSA